MTEPKPLVPSDLPSLKDGYTTPPGRANALSSLSPGLAFYPRMILTVLQAARMAKKGRYGKQEWIESSVAIVEALESSGVRLEIANVQAFQNLDAPCVFIGNHMSTLETFVLPSIIRPHRPVTFVVKKSLVEYPVFKHVMHSRNPVVVSRENPRQDLKNVLEGGEERITSGVSVVVFPQSTRSTGLDPEHFNSIGVKLARRVKAPIVPLALKTDAWKNGKLVKDFGRIDPSQRVHFEFGEPMVVTGTGKQEHAAVMDFIARRLSLWSE